jgi:hypothetical protein
VSRRLACATHGSDRGEHVPNHLPPLDPNLHIFPA